ncbi:hypothetical protein GN244_ATG12282 [Phytophthora infestans]|uniref:Uncharacterized protein n=1 Tax=Phytophthora infestans TaxID=4787 RepID=A0A833SLM1_PHYIN|nr:hypothetical protein GN244_ATG12282 [Phytophthora infestans]
MMLSALIGNTPHVNKRKLPHHAAVVPHVRTLQLSERQRKRLERQGLDLDALELVNLVARETYTPQQSKRKRGAFVDERHSGGVLLTHGQMLEALKKKDNERVAKELEK